MATITGLTAERMLEIEAASIVDGHVVGGDLILTKQDGTEINAGPVDGPPGPAGPTGPAGINGIPGEVRLWPGDVLPLLATYGKWVWADGGVYPVATYPIAAGNIAAQWRTFSGASDPGAPNFRVPDLRGLVASGLDQMPGGGARANRMTRAAAIVMAAKTGKETHALTVPELAKHKHGGATGTGTSGDDSPDHGHNGSTGPATPTGSQQRVTGITEGSTGPDNILLNIIGASGAYNTGFSLDPHSHSVSVGGATARHQHHMPALSIADEGSDIAHENVQPTVFVPYIVCLGG